MTRVTCPVGLVAICLVCVVALQLTTAAVAVDPQLEVDPGQQITCGGQPCDSVARGFRAFHDRVQATATDAGLPLPPVASTDGKTLDRKPSPEERAALLAYLRKL